MKGSGPKSPVLQAFLARLSIASHQAKSAITRFPQSKIAAAADVVRLLAGKGCPEHRQKIPRLAWCANTAEGLTRQDHYERKEAYSNLVLRKLRFQTSKGLDVQVRDYGLFPHQVDLVGWALRRGRAAIFADTGLGKSRMQVAWADTVCRETGGDVLILLILLLPSRR